MSKIEQHRVPSNIDKSRLSEYAVDKFAQIRTRKGIKKAIKKGYILVDGKIGHSADFIIGGELLELQINERKHPVLQLTLQVIYEDDHLAIINKPPGIEVSGNKARTIQNALAFNLTPSTQLDALDRMEPIHRLDYPTSGVLLIGKTRTITTLLNKMFEERKIEKTYLAISIGPIANQGHITLEIDGKPSSTYFQVLNSIPSKKYDQLNLIEIKLETGRRHQIRQHLASMDSPILGDREYGKGRFPTGSRLFLHAAQIRFICPIREMEILVKAPIPRKFEKLFPK